MHATISQPPAVVLFDPADTRKLQNPLFGLAESEVAAKAWNSGFDHSFADHAPRVVPAWVPARFRGEWLKGWDTGTDARETIEAERDLSLDSAVVSMPWGDDDEDGPFGSEGDYAEARMAWPSTWALD